MLRKFVFPKAWDEGYAEGKKEGYREGWKFALDAYGDVIFTLPDDPERRHLNLAAHQLAQAVATFNKIKIGEPPSA